MTGDAIAFVIAIGLCLYGSLHWGRLAWFKPEKFLDKIGEPLIPVPRWYLLWLGRIAGAFFLSVGVALVLTAIVAAAEALN